MRKICSSVKCRCSSAFRSCALARSVPNGFSTITPAPPRLGSPSEARAVESFDDGAVDARRNREVEEHAFAADLLQPPGEPRVQLGIVHLPRHEVHLRLQRAHDLVAAGVHLRELAQAVVELLPELLVGRVGPRDADDRESRRQTLAARQAVERRQQLAPGQVARRRRR